MTKKDIENDIVGKYLDAIAANRFSFNDIINTIIKAMNDVTVPEIRNLTNEDKSNILAAMYNKTDEKNKEQFFKTVSDNRNLDYYARRSFLNTVLGGRDSNSNFSEPEEVKDTLTPSEDLNPLVEPNTKQETQDLKSLSNDLQKIINDIKTKDVCEFTLKDKVIQHFTHNSTFKVKALKDVYDNLDREQKAEFAKLVFEDKELDADIKSDFAQYAQSKNIGNTSTDNIKAVQVQDEPKKDMGNEELSDKGMNGDTGVYGVFGDDDQQMIDIANAPIQNAIDPTTKVGGVDVVDDNPEKGADSNPFSTWPEQQTPQNLEGIELVNPQTQVVKEEPKKEKGLKVMAKKALKWSKDHKKLLIGIGLGALAVGLYLNPATHMMINSALWHLGNNLGWSTALLEKLHLTNVGLATAVKGGAYSFVNSGFYTLGGKAGAEVLYTVGKAKLVGALTGIAGVSSIGLIASSIKDKIKNRKKAKEKNVEVVETPVIDENEPVAKIDYTHERDMEKEVAALNAEVIALKNQLDEYRQKEQEYMSIIKDLKETLEALKNQNMVPVENQDMEPVDNQDVYFEEGVDVSAR